jgi:hypothetical protein
MARKKPIIIGETAFETQSSALTFYKKMLNSYIPSEKVSEIDSSKLEHLFKRHPDYEKKVGNGISHFEVMVGDYNSQCFCVIRKDGTKEGFSYKRCITQKTD